MPIDTARREVYYLLMEKTKQQQATPTQISETHQAPLPDAYRAISTTYYGLANRTPNHRAHYLALAKGYYIMADAYQEIEYANAVAAFEG